MNHKNSVYRAALKLKEKSHWKEPEIRKALWDFNDATWDSIPGIFGDSGEEIVQSTVRLLRNSPQYFSAACISPTYAPQ